MSKSSRTSPTSKAFRSAITNGTDLLAGIDGRSASARRYRDLQIAFADDLGGADKLSEADKALCRQAAAVTVQSEGMQSKIVRGEPVDAEQLVRVSNTLSRLLKAISGKSHAEPAKRTLADVMGKVAA